MELSPGLTAFCLTLFWIEFLGDIALIIVSLFVLSLVRRCAVLHWNLKVSNEKGLEKYHKAG